MNLKLKKLFSLVLVFVLLLSATSLALADNVENDVVSNPASITLEAGNTSSYVDVEFWVNPNSSDGDHQCNFDTLSEKLTFAINTPAGVTANPSSLTFNKCKDGGIFNAQKVRFSASSSAVAGSISFALIENTSGGSFNFDEADFYIYITTPPPPADTTPPVITPNVAGTLGSNGWYTSDVTVTWTVVDNESAVSNSTGCGSTLINTDTTGVTLTCSATSAGGTASESVTIKRDATAPVVSLVGGPENGASYYFGSVPAAPTCSASDATSGLNGDCSVSGYGSVVGGHTVTATATDKAGNQSSASASYTVLAWTLKGFYQPVDMNNVFNVVKGGSTVPLKFEVFAGPTELTSTTVVKSFAQAKVTCDASAQIDEVEITTTGGTSLRYDATAGQYIQNWQTPKLPGICYRVTMTTQDDSTLTAYFKLK